MDGDGNPDLYLVRGQKYRFNNTTGSNHPFAFRIASGGSAYTSGVGSKTEFNFYSPLMLAKKVYQCEIRWNGWKHLYPWYSGHNDNVGFTTLQMK